jgi:hypothetical protein
MSARSQFSSYEVLTATCTTTFRSRRHWSARTLCFCALIDSGGCCAVHGHGRWATSPHHVNTSGRTLGSYTGSQFDGRCRTVRALDSPLYLFFSFDHRGGTNDAATPLRYRCQPPAAITRRAERRKGKGKTIKLFGRASPVATVDCGLRPVLYMHTARLVRFLLWEPTPRQVHFSPNGEPG